MREASRRLLQSLFDAYQPDWVGEEDLAAIVEVSNTTRHIRTAADVQKQNPSPVLPRSFMNNEYLHFDC